jgi:hypothetical protein
MNRIGLSAARFFGLDIRPREVGLDADHHVTDLTVVAELRTGKPAIALCSPPRPKVGINKSVVDEPRPM